MVGKRSELNSFIQQVLLYLLYVDLVAALGCRDDSIFIKGRHCDFLTSFLLQKVLYICIYLLMIFNIIFSIVLICTIIIY